LDQDRQKIVQFITEVYPMPLDHAREIAGFFNYRECNKNDFLVKQGRPSNEYFFLEEGYARAYTYDLEGNDVTTAFYGPRQVVCELFSFFKRIPSKENIQALEDCKTWFLTFEELQQVFHSMPQFREFGRTILVNAYATLKTRMLSMLHETAEERYENLLRSNPDIFQHAPLKQIASYLGVTDTSLSRIRKDILRSAAARNLSNDK
jgi:CRP-like cAMP-binding protein